MEFVVIVVISLAALGIVAALLSRGGGDDEITRTDGCAGCTEQSECKLKKLCDASTKAVVATMILLAAAACSTKKNTSQTRWWHAFNAHYNIYYNGTLAYIDASLEKENAHKDNFTEIIPLYPVGSKNSRQTGKGNYDKAVEKCQKAIKLHSIKKRPEWNKSRKKTERDIEWLSRREYNPFLWKAWMLMGRSQFHSGQFEEAAATFSYMSRLYKTQPAIYGKARAWLAKTYVEQDYLYDAEDVIRNMQRDSLDWRAVKEWDYTYADYYIHTGEYEKAIPYLKKVIKHEMRRKQKAREWFLLGQLQAATGHKQQAYKAFKHVVRLNPPYEVAFNARIAMTEVLAEGKAKQMISKLKRMAYSDNNKDFLDQIYYAIGNIYMAQKDTTKAIAAYEKGKEKATRSGVEKGVLLLALGDLYWQKGRFHEASECYSEAIGQLDKERDGYEQLADRAKVLETLVPYTDAIHLQDSLQRLAQMSEAERNKIIDKVIADLKKKEKEERDKQEEAGNRNTGTGSANTGGNTPQAANATANSRNAQKEVTWYFYNQLTVNQGKEAFQRQWGKRENADDWQRSNKTVVATDTGEEPEYSEEQLDSIARAEAVADSLAQVPDSAKNDPHKREYYLAQIPFTPEQVEASNQIIEDGLHHAGVIFKDQLDMLDLSEKHLRRLTDKYPEYDLMDDVYYHLFLLYSRQQRHDIAEAYVEKLKNEYPESRWTILLTDPYFKENALFGKQIEDSLYAATYEAFKASRYQEVKGNTHVSETRFPMGANRDKFIFIGGLSKLNDGDADGCLEDMNNVVKNYPGSRLSEMAGMIVNGVKAGRQLHGGKFDINEVWAQRQYVMSDSDSIAVRTFSADRDKKFTFMLVYHPDSVNENQLLFEVAKFNFTSFLVRNFDIEIDEVEGIHRMKISGFLRYDEALEYARRLHAQEAMSPLLEKVRTILINEADVDLLGTRYSYEDYETFYKENLETVKVDTGNLLQEPAELPDTEEPFLALPPLPKETEAPAANMTDDNKQADEPEDDNEVQEANEPEVFTTEEPKANTNEPEEFTTEEPEANTNEPEVFTNEEPKVTTNEPEVFTTEEPKVTTNEPKAETPEPPTGNVTVVEEEDSEDVDDEYYDLDGF